MENRWHLWLTAALCGLLVAIVFVGCGCKKEEAEDEDEKIQITEEMKETTTATVGQEIDFTLDSNPTTGYVWSLEKPLNTKNVKLLNNDFVAPETDQDGAGGKEVWRFRAVGAGNTSIVLIYSQPWDRETSPAKRLTIELAIAEADVREPENQYQRIETTAGSDFEIALAASPSTGYSWKETKSPDAKMAKLKESHFVSGSEYPGAEGKEVLKYGTSSPGNTTIVLELTGPQGAEPHISKRMTVSLIINPQKDQTPKIYHNPTAPITASKGEVFKIELDSNQSTGYAWKTEGEIDNKVILLLGTEYHVLPGSEPGGEGKETWAFESVGSGTQVLNFQYVSPEGVAEKEMKITVNVK